MDYAIRTERLSVVYLAGTAAETKALNEVNIRIKPEEFVIVFGPSGCGKSTLLYTLSGAERRITDGEIWVGGRDLRNMSQKDLVRFHRETVGFVFQAHNLIPTITVLDNVALPMVFRGVPKKERNEKGMELLKRFGVENLSTKLPHELSGGQQQRVGIARALANDAEILLADEPTGNLDSKSAANVMQTFQTLNEKLRKTIVLVTHSPKFLPFATHIIHMKDGKVLKDEFQTRRRWDASALIDTEDAGPGGGEEGGSNTVHANRLINHVGLNLTPDSYTRLEDTLKKFFDKQITQRKLFEMLDTPYKSGGVGLYKQTAQNLAQSAEDILIVSDILSQVKTEDDVRDNSAHIMTWILHDTQADLTVGQIERLKESLIKRITKKYGAEDFQKELDTSFKEGGVGLNWRTAKNLSQKLEVVLG